MRFSSNAPAPNCTILVRFHSIVSLSNLLNVTASHGSDCMHPWSGSSCHTCYIFREEVDVHLILSSRSML
ncbi:hypothetical protein ACN47E_007473 [Coniothyrium glycines]